MHGLMGGMEKEDEMLFGKGHAARGGRGHPDSFIH